MDEGGTSSAERPEPAGVYQLQVGGEGRAQVGFSAAAINASGTVAGMRQQMNLPAQAVRWNGLAFEWLQHDQLRSARATGINAAGVVVGRTEELPGSLQPRAARWTGATLELLADSPSRAWGINDAGLVVGSALRTFEDGSREQPAIWQDGELRWIAGVESHAAHARAISNAGHVVGNTDALAFLWHEDVLRLLPAPEGYAAAAVHGINDAGIAVGMTWNAVTRRAVRWIDGHPDLLPALSAADASGEALAINAAGAIIGTSGGRPTLWCGSAVYDLSEFAPTGWTLYSAVAINERGQIAGAASDGRSTYVYVLSPVRQPEPCAAP